MTDCLPNAHVREVLHTCVEAHVVITTRDALDCEVGVLLQARYLFGEHASIVEINLSRLQAEQARTVFRNRTEVHSRESGLLSPIALERFDLKCVIALPTHKAIRAGTDRSLVERLVVTAQILRDNRELSN